MSNDFLDRLVHPEVYLCQRAWPAFHVCGAVGLAFALLLTQSLVVYRGLSPWVMLVLTLTALATFLGLAMMTKIIGGEEQLIYYQHHIAIMAVAALLLQYLQQPILPYLDVTILGLGLFLVCGRVGCLMVGCCYGRPCSWGVRYRAEHGTAGFPSYYVGVRLFPIQAIEALWSLGLICVGSAFVVADFAPGTALAWSVVTYGLGRFCFEFGRGDPVRPELWGFSQAQWISLLLLCLVVWAEWSALLPYEPWHLGASAWLALAMLAVTVRRHKQETATYKLLHPRHVKEIAAALALTSPLSSARVHRDHWMVATRRDIKSTTMLIGCTSQGVQISAGKIASTGGWIEHFSLSSRQGGMSEETARILARLILQLKQAAGAGEFLKGSQEVFHVLIHPRMDKVWAH